MKTLLVWFLVIQPYGINSVPVIAGPFATAADCERIQAAVERKSKCIQANIPTLKGNTL